MTPHDASRQRYSIHGTKLELTCKVPKLAEPIERTLGDFKLHAGEAPGTPISGLIREYNQHEVLRCLSTSAKRISPDHEPAEIYSEGERFWCIDDHWGLCEINILKGQWRSWVLPTTLATPTNVVERAVLWPMSQLSAPRGLSLLPSAAVTRDGWGVLLLAVADIEPELSALVRAGYRVVGQNWTALRQIDQRIVMFQMPGQLHRAGKPIDLTREFYGCAIGRAVCDAVLLISPNRRAVTNLHPLGRDESLDDLRRRWPVPEVHSPQRQQQLMGCMAQRCGVFRAQLSRNAWDILPLLESARAYRPNNVSVSILATHLARRAA